MDGARAFGAQNHLEINIRYSEISIKLIIKEQVKILKSVVEVAEIELIIISIIWIEVFTLIHQTNLVLEARKLTIDF